MAKALNLDEFAKEKRVLTWNGVSYDMQETTVEGYIELTKATAVFDENASPVEQLEMMLKLVSVSFPDIPEPELRKLKLTQVNAIVEFIRADDRLAEEAAKANEAAVDGNAPGK